jgi:hypothetical protein
MRKDATLFQLNMDKSAELRYQVFLLHALGYVKLKN